MEARRIGRIRIRMMTSRSGDFAVFMAIVSRNGALTTKDTKETLSGFKPLSDFVVDEFGIPPGFHSQPRSSQASS